jgi:MmyB-like transcription regulator ligand binding domain
MDPATLLHTDILRHDAATLTSEVIGASPPPAYSGGRERRPPRATSDPSAQAESHRPAPHWNILLTNEAIGRVMGLLRTGDAETRRLLDELLSSPDVPRQWQMLDLDASTAPFLAIELRKDDARFSFFTLLASLGTPYDITLHELRIECFFAADAATEAALRRLSEAGGSTP